MRIALAGILCLCGFLALAETSIGSDRAGDVVEFDPLSLVDNVKIETKPHSFADDSMFETSESGHTRLIFVDPRIPLKKRELRLLPESKAKVFKQGNCANKSTKICIELIKGSLRLIGLDETKLFKKKHAAEIVAGNANIVELGTDMIIAFDERTQVVEVTCLRGSVLTRNTKHAGEIVLGPGERTIIDPAWPPTLPERLSEAELQRLVSETELIGDGEAESQMVDHAILQELLVPDPDRAPRELNPSIGEPSVWPSPCPAVFCEPFDTVRDVNLEIGF